MNFAPLLQAPRRQDRLLPRRRGHPRRCAEADLASVPADRSGGRRVLAEFEHGGKVRSLRALAPFASAARRRRVRVRLSAVMSPASGPLHVVVTARREPSPDAMISWRDVEVTPGKRFTQVNCVPGWSSVSSQTSGSRPGCLSRARLPTWSGPESSRFTSVTNSVHCGQESMSTITCHTRSGAAAMSIAMCSDSTHRC